MISGVVKELRVFKTGKGGNAYSIIMDDDEMYGCGFEHPNVEEGDKVSFKYEQKGKYKNIDMSSLTKEGKGEAPPKNNNNKGGGSKDEYWNNKDAEIKHQGCRNSAIEVVKVAHEQGLVQVPQKKDQKFDAFLTLIDEITDKFIKDTEAYAQGKKSSSEKPKQEKSSKSESPAAQADDSDEDEFE